MDLTQSYHNFVKAAFVKVVRTANRFHVKRYIIDALRAIHRRISKVLPIGKTKELKK